MTGELAGSLKQVEELKTKLEKITEEFSMQKNANVQNEQELSDQVQRLENQVKTVSKNILRFKNQFLYILKIF